MGKKHTKKTMAKKSKAVKTSNGSPSSKETPTEARQRLMKEAFQSGHPDRLAPATYRSYGSFSRNLPSEFSDRTPSASLPRHEEKNPGPKSTEEILCVRKSELWKVKVEGERGGKLRPPTIIEGAVPLADMDPNLKGN